MTEKELRDELVEMRARLGLEHIPLDVFLDTDDGGQVGLMIREDEFPKDFPPQYTRNFFDSDGEPCVAVPVRHFATAFADYIEKKAAAEGFDYVVVGKYPLFVQAKALGEEDLEAQHYTFKTMLFEHREGFEFDTINVDELTQALFSRLGDEGFKQALWDLLQVQKDEDQR